MKRITWLIIGMSMFGCLTGCSKKQEPPKAAQACDLVTPQEFQAAFGAAAKVNTAAATPEKCCADAQGASVCVWLSRGIAGTSTRDKSQLHIVEMTGFYPGQPINPVGVAGLGDTASWVENVGELFVFKGNVLLRVTVNPPERATLAQVKALAEKAVPRLPN